MNERDPYLLQMNASVVKYICYKGDNILPMLCTGSTKGLFLHRIRSMIMNLMPIQKITCGDLLRMYY